jgi:small-conductance mechanosensitive channel
MAEEDDKQRVNRELIELLNELRVALPGVQVLFAFLLAVPFQQRFGQATAFQRHAYFLTLVLALLATALLIAPSAYHRLNFRQNDKHEIVMASNRLTLVGLACLALAMVGVMALIGDVLFGTATAVVSSVGAAALFGGLWAVLPLRERRRAQRRGDTP